MEAVEDDDTAVKVVSKPTQHDVPASASYGRPSPVQRRKEEGVPADWPCRGSSLLRAG